MAFLFRPSQRNITMRDGEFALEAGVDRWELDSLDFRRKGRKPIIKDIDSIHSSAYSKPF